MQLTHFLTENDDQLHPSPRQVTTAFLERPIRVLQVEDDPEAAELVRRCLETEENHFTVTSRSTLREAMELLAQPEADIILLDLGLPELSGYKSYRALAIASLDSIPIVVYTGDENSATRRLIEEMGAMDYLLKHQCTATRLRESLWDAVTSYSRTRRVRATAEPVRKGDSMN